MPLPHSRPSSLSWPSLPSAFQQEMGKYSQPRKSLPFGFWAQIPRAHPATTGSRPGPCHYVFPQGTRLEKQHPKLLFGRRLLATPKGTAHSGHAKKCFQTIKLSLQFLRLAIGTRITGASQAAVVSTTEAGAFTSEAASTAQFDHARSRCQEPSVSQKPHGHTNDSCELRPSFPWQASKATQATPKQHIVFKRPWDIVTIYRAIGRTSTSAIMAKNGAIPPNDTLTIPYNGPVTHGHVLLLTDAKKRLPSRLYRFSVGTPRSLHVMLLTDAKKRLDCTDST